jgi:hypothetical protein
MRIYCHNQGRNITDEVCEMCKYYDRKTSPNGCDYLDELKHGWGD